MATATRDFDLLFMIDNSSSMQVSQTAFVNAFPSLVSALQALPGGMPNLHIAVVSSDMGAGTEWAYCRGTGNSAEFQYLPRAPCTATTLTAASYFISNVNGQANYTGTLDQVFRCIAPLGTMGCGFEQPLLSIERALGADGAPAPALNYSFLRANADLILVLLTNEDDCSATGGASNPLFGSSGTDNLSGTFGPPSQFRCNEFGHMCDEGPPQRRGNVDEMKPHTNCRSNEHSVYIRSVASFARNIKALKPFPDQQISVVAITGVSPSDPNGAIPYSVKYTVRSSSSDDAWPSVNQACGVSTTEPFGDPSLRVVEFTRQFGANGAVFSICRDNYAPVMDAIAQRIAQRTQTTGAGGTTGSGGSAAPAKVAPASGGAGGNCTADLIAGLASHVRPQDRRHALVLGLQRPRSARRRNDERRSPTAARAGRRARRRHRRGVGRLLPHLRPEDRRHVVVLGSQRRAVSSATERCRPPARRP